MKTLNVGVTGGSGFLGSNLIKKLSEENIKFEVLDRSKNDLLNPQSLREFVEGKDVIIHLAGKNKDSSLTEMEKVNVFGTRSLMEAISKYNPSAKIIFASSFMIYIKEDTFGITKKKAEGEIDKYSKKLKGIILRFSNIYGPGGKPFQNSVISTLTYKIKKREKIVVSGDGSQARDFLFIADAINAIIKAIYYIPRDIEYFDICTGKNTSINEVIQTLKSQVKRKVGVEYDASILNHLYNLNKTYLAAKEKLGWKPNTSLSSGLKMTLKSF